MVTDVYQYDPYGQVTLGSTKHTDFYGYNAESYNPNTGLEYLRARYYNAEKGRFFQEDTNLGDITDPLILNRYAYVKNSPPNYEDPTGNEPEIDYGQLAIDAYQYIIGDKVEAVKNYFNLKAEDVKEFFHSVKETAVGTAEIVDRVIDTEIITGVGVGVDATVADVNITLILFKEARTLDIHGNINMEAEDLSATAMSSQNFLGGAISHKYIPEKGKYQWVVNTTIGGVDINSESLYVELTGMEAYMGVGAGYHIRLNLQELCNLLNELADTCG